MYGDKTFTFTYDSGATTSDDIANVKAYQYFEMDIPAFGSDLAAAGASVSIQGGLTAAAGHTMIRMGVYSAGSGLLEWATVSGAGGISVEVPLWGMPFASPVLSTACTNGLYEIKITGYNDK